MGKAFYQPHEFSILQDSFALQLSEEYQSKQNEQVLIYSVGALNKTIVNKYDYNNKSGWNRIKIDKIKLPTYANGSIAFDYMEAYIKELEAERIKELEAYLVATGLNDYALTAEEQQLIEDFRNGGVSNYGEFMLGDLFEIQKTLSFNKDKLTTVGDKKYAYVTRTSLNNGILQYTDFVNNENINSENTYSLGLLQMNFFYQKSKWYAGQFVRKITPKFKMDDNIAKYFNTILNKQQKLLLSVLVRSIDKTFNNTKIKLPITDTGDIDFNYMIKYIRAIEKLVIRGVIEWKDKQIEATKNITNQ
ncbi:MAG: restriction endonuclease subunit S [Lactobacillaceae bacterium]|jgi:hypothetical protein|nr:restriction endonuclease subunit S [Lactobacillaceae bacterium]